MKTIRLDSENQELTVGEETITTGQTLQVDDETAETLCTAWHVDCSIVKDDDATSEELTDEEREEEARRQEEEEAERLRREAGGGEIHH